jgi:hypothetical protein
MVNHKGYPIMKRTILLIATSFLIASSLHAISLTWRFSGTTSSSTEFNGMPIAEGLNYEFRIFLDTDLIGVKDNGNPEVSFFGPHQGEVEIETLGVLPVDQIVFVQYFALGGLSQTLYFTIPDLMISTSIPSFRAIACISVRSPRQRQTHYLSNTISFSGPNGLFGSTEVVDIFSATTVPGVPDGGTTVMLLGVALGALGMARRSLKS